MRKPNPPSSPGASLTIEEAQQRFFTSTRHTLTKGQLRRLYKTEQGETVLTAKWEMRDGQPVLVGNGLNVTFTRSKVGAVIGVVVQK
jgi:hypothetical protein